MNRKYNTPTQFAVYKIRENSIAKDSQDLIIGSPFKTVDEAEEWKNNFGFKDERFYVDVLNKRN